MASKHIFVTGGVVSGLGKGISAASLGRLLKQRGLRVAAQKPSAWFQARCDYTLESTEADTVDTFAQRARALFQQILQEG